MFHNLSIVNKKKKKFLPRFIRVEAENLVRVSRAVGTNVHMYVVVSTDSEICQNAIETSFMVTANSRTVPRRRLDFFQHSVLIRLAYVV